MVCAVSVTVGRLVAALDREFPFGWAEPWDRVGLLAGDPDAAANGVFVTLDPTPAALESCVAAGANVLLTHHPAFLSPPTVLRPGNDPAGLVFQAVRSGVALVACHTNLDRAPAGASSLARAIGLQDGTPLESAQQPVSVVTVFLPQEPPEIRAQVVRAMEAAGAGRIGDYDGCSFSAAGTGGYTPLADAHPAVGRSTGAGNPITGEPVEVPEERVEMVCGRDDCGRVAQAARLAHPYEEPLIVCSDATIARGAARLGRVCDLPQPRTIEELARDVADKLGSMPRVWGSHTTAVRRVATATGSAGGLLSEAIASGADAFVAGEVRYHDALTAVASGLSIIELGHDVSEWPLVPVLGAAVRRFDPDMTVEVQPPQSRWWTP